MTVRRSAAVLLATAATLGLAACGGSSSPAASPVTPGSTTTTSPAAASATGAATATATATSAPASSAPAPSAVATTGAPAAGATSTAATGGSGGSAADPQALTYLTAALHKVDNVGSARVTGTVTTSAAGQKISLTLAGVERWAPTIAAKFTMSGLSVGGASVGTVTELMTSKAIYLKMPALAAQTHKPWVELSFAELKKASGVDLSQVTQQAQQMQPAQYLQMLSASGDVKLVGTEKVDGVQTQHFAGTVDPTKALAALSPQARAAWAKLGASGEHLDVWVDSKGQPRRMTVSVTGAALAMTTDLHLSSYGVKVSVTPPPANQTADLAKLLPSS